MQRFLRASVVLAIAVLVMLAGLMLGTNTATAASTTSQLSIEDQAQFINPLFINVQVDVKCSGGTGTVTVSVTQTAAQSSNGVGDSGTGVGKVNCNGNEQKLAVTIPGSGGLWNLGSATAQASLTAPSGPAFDEKTINIVL